MKRLNVTALVKKRAMLGDYYPKDFKLAIHEQFSADSDRNDLIIKEIKNQGYQVDRLNSVAYANT